jgi:hypothetical protein
MRLFFISLFTLCYALASAQISQEATPPGILYNLPEVKISQTYNPDIDWDAVYEEDRHADKNGLPLRVGLSLPASINLSGNNGQWHELSNGDMLWQMALSVSGANSVGLVFDSFHLALNAELYFYDRNRNLTIGAFTSDNNNRANVFSTQILPGSEIVIEYIERKSVKQTAKHTLKDNTDELFISKDDIANYKPASNLNICEISYIYADVYSVFDAAKPSPGASGDCEIDINCSPAGDNWQEQKRGVAHILFREGSSWYVCTGSLVNNTNEDEKPYFLTAFHCGGDASSDDRLVWKFYFNFEKPSCGSGTAPQSDVLTGCELVAKGLLDGGSDFQLLQLSTAVPDNYNPYYNGWSRNTAAATSGAGIHHPSGDVKKISTFSSSLTATGSINIGGDVMASNSAWAVKWSENENGWGVTEGGSSGSPIFNQNGMVVGTLSGGSSSCDNQNGYDYYGRFNYHWESNGTTADLQLKPWLDPAGTNVTELSGFDPFDTNPDDVVFEESFEGDNFPPVNWTRESSVASYTWKQTAGYSIEGNPPTPIEPQEGSQFAYVEWQDAEQQDEWLISPAYNLTNAYGFQFSFWFSGSPYWSVEKDFCDLTLKVKTNNSDWTDIWSEHDETDWPTYAWAKVIIDDLTALEGESGVQFAFVYTGNDGANFNIYNIVFQKAGGTLSSEPLKQAGINIYPNPSSGLFKVSLRSEYSYFVTDITGRTVKSGSMNAGEQLLDISEQSPGMYFLRLEASDNYTFKLIKQ